MSNIVTVNNSLEALRFVAWLAFKKVAVQIDIERDAYINRESYVVAGHRVSPYTLQESRHKFLLDMELETPDNIFKKIAAPPPPTVTQRMEMAKHKNTFLRTWIPDSQEKLQSLIGHYDEECFSIVSTDMQLTCLEFLSKRPIARDIPAPPPRDDVTHGRILSYVWADVGDEQYETDITWLNPLVTLTWIRESSLTIANQLREFSLTA